MESLFNSACRYMSDSELIYEIANNRQVVSDIQKDEVLDIDKLFSSLTPGRKKVAVAAVEMYKRQQVQRVELRAIRSSTDIFELMQPIIGDLPNEEFWIISLNQVSRVIKKVMVSVGGINQTSADVRIIMRVLIESGASQFAAVHNHPSGFNRPSEDDRKVTEQLKKAAEIFNIRFTDHIIVAGRGYYSFNDEGCI